MKIEQGLELVITMVFYIMGLWVGDVKDGLTLALLAIIAMEIQKK